MRTSSGSSSATDPAQAVSEATRAWTLEHPEIVFVFVSTAQPADGIARAVQARFPEALVVGCTTAGEHEGGRFRHGSCVLAGVDSGGAVRWQAEVCGSGQPRDEAAARGMVERMLEGLGTSPERCDPRRFFCLTFLDGLDSGPERVAAAMAEGLDGIQLVGGSVADDMAFRQTQVILGDQAHASSNLFVLASTDLPFRTLEHHHFEASSTRFVVTRADAERRIVHELDGYPAAQAYARAIGVEVEALGEEVFAMHPLLYACQGNNYLRSLHRVGEDGSLSFWSAIEAGMVLDLARHTPMLPAFEAQVRALTREGRAPFLVGWSCAHRGVEAAMTKETEAMAATLAQAADVAIAFECYGEQLNGLQMNLTFTALILGEPRPACR